MKLVFDPRAWRDYVDWQQEDRKVALKINALVKECLRTPFEGTGRPEALKHDWAGWWSRRIDREHRLVYRVIGTGEAQTLEISSCRGHY